MYSYKINENIFIKNKYFTILFFYFVCFVKIGILYMCFLYMYHMEYLKNKDSILPLHDKE